MAVDEPVHFGMISSPSLSFLSLFLGKTVQAAAFLGAAAASRKLKSVLIVAPATMLQHWLSELAGKFGGKPC